MIHIQDDYYAKPDSIGFSLVKKTERVNKKGETIFTTIGYCGDIYEVCWLAYRTIAGEKLSKVDCELKEAILILQETKNNLERVLGGFS